jgi:hypothetical protein
MQLMMSSDSFRQPEVPEIPVAGRHVGDTSLLTPDAVIHLPNCHSIANQKADCSCGAVHAKPSEFFTERAIGDIG